MADTLRITTPLPPNAGVNKAATPREADPMATIDPTRVISKDANSQNTNKGNLEFAWNRNSVFNAFAQKLMDTPALNQTLEKLLIGIINQSKIETGALSKAEQGTIQELIQNLAKNIEMDETQILQNLLFQQKNSTSFNSDLFKLLRSLSTSENFDSIAKDYVGRFLKAYDGYFTASTTMEGIIIQLKDILNGIPKSYSDIIHEQMGELVHNPSPEALESNLKILKESIIPMIGRYVSSTNDMSVIREKIALLTNDISRLNISTQKEVQQRFEELVEYCKYSLNVPADRIQLLNNLFVKEMVQHEQQDNKVIDLLMNILMNASSEKTSTTSQTMLKDITTSMLLDKSAFMPYNHFVLPLNYNGTFMFSEIWVEKDNSKRQTQDDKIESSRRIILSFDIQGIGEIKTVIDLKSQSVSLGIGLPKELEKDSKEIKGALNNIFENNGFGVDRIISLPEDFVVKNEIIRKVCEGRSSINVSV